MDLDRNEMVKGLKRETLESQHFGILRTEMFEHTDPIAEASDET